MITRLTFYVFNSLFMKLTFTVLLFLSICAQSYGQNDSLVHQKIYFVKPKIELTTGIGLTVASFFGFRQLDKVAHLSKEDILKLNPNDLNSFDRPIAFKNPANFASAEKNSDLFLNLSLVSPLDLQS